MLASSRPGSARMPARNSAGSSTTNGASSPASTRGTQSSRSARSRIRTQPGSASRGSTVAGPAGRRVRRVPTSPRTRTEIRCRHGVFAQAPAGRVAAPAEIADVVAYLAGPGASFVQGAVLAVDGGRRAV